MDQQGTAGKELAPSDEAPQQKKPDHQDKSSVGEEDPGAAIEEMRDPNPDAKAPPRPSKT